MWIIPQHTTLEFRMAEFQVSAVPSRVFAWTIRTNDAFYLSIDRFEWSHNFFSVDFEIHWFISIIWGKTTSFFTSSNTEGSSSTTTAWTWGTRRSRRTRLSWVAWGSLGSIRTYITEMYLFGLHWKNMWLAQENVLKTINTLWHYNYSNKVLFELLCDQMITNL